VAALNRVRELGPTGPRAQPGGESGS
jgi:hypothetical protein